MQNVLAMGYKEHQNDYDTHLPHLKDTYNTVSTANGLASNEFTLTFAVAPSYGSTHHSPDRECQQPPYKIVRGQYALILCSCQQAKLSPLRHFPPPQICR